MADIAEDVMAACATGTADTATCTEEFIGTGAATAIGLITAATIARTSGQGTTVAATATVTVASIGQGIGAV